MNIAQRYFLETGETVGAAVSRLSRLVSVEVAAHRIGYYDATRLRKYMSSRGIPDPWPLAKPRGRNNPIPDDVAKEFAKRWRETGSPKKAAEGLGFNSTSLYRRMKRDNL